MILYRINDETHESDGNVEPMDDDGCHDDEVNGNASNQSNRKPLLAHKCVSCQLRFSSLFEMLDHRNENHLDEIKCHLCNKIFSTPKRLEDHKQNKHNEKTGHSKVVTKFGIKLVRHDDDYGSDRGDEKEDECEKNDGDSSKSRRKPFECGTCGVGFIIEAFLKKHIDLHGVFFYTKNMFFQFHFNNTNCRS